MANTPSRPLSMPVVHILLVLADEPRHGYAIKQEVEARTAGAIRLGPGTLYEAIQRLEDGGLIEEAGRPVSERSVNGQQAQRRYYRLTARGWTALRDEVRQLDHVLELARSNPRLRKELA
jgi:DNA-binding PadR family transcriptional regulator